MVAKVVLPGGTVSFESRGGRHPLAVATEHVSSTSAWAVSAIRATRASTPTPRSRSKRSSTRMEEACSWSQRSATAPSRPASPGATPIIRRRCLMSSAWVRFARTAPCPRTRIATRCSWTSRATTGDLRRAPGTRRCPRWVAGDVHEHRVAIRVRGHGAVLANRTHADDMSSAADNRRSSRARGHWVPLPTAATTSTPLPYAYSTACSSSASRRRGSVARIADTAQAEVDDTCSVAHSPAEAAASALNDTGAARENDLGDHELGVDAIPAIPTPFDGLAAISPATTSRGRSRRRAVSLRRSSSQQRLGRRDRDGRRRLPSRRPQRESAPASALSTRTTRRDPSSGTTAALREARCRRRLGRSSPRLRRASPPRQGRRIPLHAARSSPTCRRPVLALGGSTHAVPYPLAADP